MKVKIRGHQIIDADITKVSLVKRGANRVPFTIIKDEDEGMRWVPGAREARDSFFARITKVDQENRMNSIRKASFQPPQAGGEIAADTEEKARRRDQDEAERALDEKIVRLEDEFRLIEVRPGIPEASRRSVLYDLRVEINGLKRVLADLRTPNVAKRESIDAFDLLAHGITTGNAVPPVVADIAALPERLSKEEQAADRDFWAQIERETSGVGLRSDGRRQEPLSKREEELRSLDLSDPFGVAHIRRARMLRR